MGSHPLCSWQLLNSKIKTQEGRVTALVIYTLLINLVALTLLISAFYILHFLSHIGARLDLPAAMWCSARLSSHAPGVRPQKALRHQLPAFQSKEAVKEGVPSGFEAQTQILHWLMSSTLQPQQVQGLNAGSQGLCWHQPQHPSPLPSGEQNQLLLLLGPWLLKAVLVTQNTKDYLPLEQMLLSSSGEEGDKADRRIPETTCRTVLHWATEVTYIYFLGPLSSFFTWHPYWLVHVCVVPEEVTLPALRRACRRLLRVSYHIICLTHFVWGINGSTDAFYCTRPIWSHI